MTGPKRTHEQQLQQEKEELARDPYEVLGAWPSEDMLMPLIPEPEPLGVRWRRWRRARQAKKAGKGTA